MVCNDDVDTIIISEIQLKLLLNDIQYQGGTNIRIEDDEDIKDVVPQFY